MRPNMLLKRCKILNTESAGYENFFATSISAGPARNLEFRSAKWTKNFQGSVSLILKYKKILVPQCDRKTWILLNKLSTEKEKRKSIMISIVMSVTRKSDAWRMPTIVINDLSGSILRHFELVLSQYMFIDNT